MKLIIAGATGTVATEVVSQALRMREITSIIALARKPVTVENGLNTAKLKNVLIKDYAEYSDEVKKEFAGANACIWTVAITPSKSRLQEWELVKRVCQTSTLAGLRAMYDAGPAKPFRFLYMSGANAERDQTKKLQMLGQYRLMRGETENQVLAFAGEHKDDVDACVVKPGLITDSTTAWRSVVATVVHSGVSPIAGISTTAVVAAMLDQVIHGFEKESLMNDELVSIGAKVLQEQSESEAKKESSEEVGA